MLSDISNSKFIYMICIVVYVCLQDGSNSILTNYKLALLPRSLHHMAVNPCEKYERGELCPPASAKQRQRKTLSSSSFNFLRLNPQKKEHQEEIGRKLQEWLDSKTCPQEICRVNFLSKTWIFDFLFYCPEVG